MIQYTTRKIIFAFSAVFLAAIIFYSCFFKTDKAVTGHMILMPGYSRLYVEEYGSVINGYEDDGVVYFFLPAYMHLDGVDYEMSLLRIYEKDGELLIKPKMNEIMEVDVGEDNTLMTPYKVAFYQSENLYSIDISLSGNSIGDIDHDDYIDGFMVSHSPDGTMGYAGKVSIKGRGNSTWGNPKNPYEIKLADEVSFCGMKPSDKWALLANYFDDTKIVNKMVYDTAAKIGMEYAIESDWIDLYINGDYVGNYLMCHEPHISSTDLDIGNLEKENRPFFDPHNTFDNGNLKGYNYTDLPHDISGGYLVEATYLDIYEMKNSGFILDSGKAFSIKSPDNAAFEEVQYIAGFMNNIDSEIHTGDVREALKHIDIDSFAKRFLIDEVFYNVDESKTSYFFYKKPDYNILYAGPCWDYDKSCGIGGRGRDYTESTLDDYSLEPLDWIERLMAYPYFRKYVAELLENKKIFFESVVSSGIDNYYNKIYASLVMDNIRYGNDGSEEAFDNLREYLNNRFIFVERMY